MWRHLFCSKVSILMKNLQNHLSKENHCPPKLAETFSYPSQWKFHNFNSYIYLWLVFTWCKIHVNWMRKSSNPWLISFILKNTLACIQCIFIIPTSSPHFSSSPTSPNAFLYHVHILFIKIFFTFHFLFKILHAIYFGNFPVIFHLFLKKCTNRQQTPETSNLQSSISSACAWV